MLDLNSNINRLESFKSLEKGWYFPDAEVIDKDIIEFAKKMLDFFNQSKLFVVPNSDGGVTFELDDDKTNISLYLHFEPSENMKKGFKVRCTILDECYEPVTEDIGE